MLKRTFVKILMIGTLYTVRKCYLDYYLTIYMQNYIGESKNTTSMYVWIFQIFLTINFFECLIWSQLFQAKWRWPVCGVLVMVPVLGALHMSLLYFNKNTKICKWDFFMRKRSKNWVTNYNTWKREMLKGKWVRET